MNMPCVFRAEMGGGPTNTGETVLRHVEVKKEACRRFAEGTHLVGLGPGGGFFTLADHVLPNGPREQAEFFNELQRIALSRTRLRIPLLQTEEGTHGLMCSGGTVFPEGPALGSTWNMDLIERIYAAAAHEARAVGVHQLFTLVIEPVRDPRMGRNQGANSEDPYLTARMGRGHRAGRPGRRCLEARQSCGGPLPRSRPESAGERSGARRHGDIRTHVPDRISSVVGESRETSGEGRDVASLDLSGLQEDLIQAVHAAGTPTVVVLINGRPLSTRWVAEHIPAIVGAWLPGEQGGHAVAEVLFGDVNPGGRLPVTVPRHVG